MFNVTALLEQLNPLIPQIITWLLTYSLHSSLILIAVWLISQIRKSRDPHVQDTLWKIAIMGGILTTSLQLASGLEPIAGHHQLGNEPESHQSFRTQLESKDIDPAELLIDFPVESAVVSKEVTSTFLVISSEDKSASPFTDMHQNLFSELQPRQMEVTVETDYDSGFVWAGDTWNAQLEDLSATFPAMKQMLENSAENHPTLIAGSLAKWIFWIWLGISFLLILRFFISYYQLRRSIGERIGIYDGPLRENLDRLLVQTGSRRKVKLTCSTNIVSPIAFGLREICLPVRAMHELSEEEQRTMLAHELAHLLRHDPLWLVTTLLLNSILFFQPLNHLARRRMEETAEYLCDDWALLHTSKKIDFAKCLTQVAEWVGNRPQPGFIAAMGGRPSMLVRRVSRILNDTPQKCAPWRRVKTVMPIVVLMLTVTWAAPTLAPPSPQKAIFVYSVESDVISDSLRMAFPDAATLQPGSYRYFFKSNEGAPVRRAKMQIRRMRTEP